MLRNVIGSDLLEMFPLALIPLFISMQCAGECGKVLPGINRYSLVWIRLSISKVCLKLLLMERDESGTQDLEQL